MPRTSSQLQVPYDNASLDVSCLIVLSLQIMVWAAKSYSLQRERDLSWVFKSQPPTAVFPLIADLSSLNLESLKDKWEVEGLATVQFPVLPGPVKDTLTVERKFTANR
jgi:hypothetical protein